MSTLQYGVLFLFILLSRKSLVLATTTTCPDNNCCTIIQNQLSDMMNLILAMNSTLTEQVKNMEEMKTNIDQVVVATNLTSTQLSQHNVMHDQLVHDDRLKLHDELSNFTESTHQKVESTYGAELTAPTSERRASQPSESTASILGATTDAFKQTSNVIIPNSPRDDNWLVFQRRIDGSEDFERHYSDYERGFGNLTREFWLGNEKLSLLTTKGRYKLRIELEDFEGEKRYAEYSNFTVAAATDKYRLTVGGYSGNAGNSMTYHSGMQFTTGDVDNDAWTGGNCAMVYRGAWWYNACHASNLNGRYLRGPHVSYADGIEWTSWHGYYYSLKTTEMKIAAY